MRPCPSRRRSVPRQAYQAVLGLSLLECVGSVLGLRGGWGCCRLCKPSPGQDGLMPEKDVWAEWFTMTGRGGSCHSEPFPQYTNYDRILVYSILVARSVLLLFSQQGLGTGSHGWPLARSCPPSWQGPCCAVTSPPCALTIPFCPALSVRAIACALWRAAGGRGGVAVRDRVEGV